MVNSEELICAIQMWRYIWGVAWTDVIIRAVKSDSEGILSGVGKNVPTPTSV
jgi:hypothetical protein